MKLSSFAPAQTAMATVQVIAVLKMTAWLDRPAERERDLQDIAQIFDDYLEPDDLRRWDDALITAATSWSLPRQVAGLARSSPWCTRRQDASPVARQVRPSQALDAELSSRYQQFSRRSES